MKHLLSSTLTCALLATRLFAAAPDPRQFIDEGSQGFRFESNVVHRTSGASVRFNQCEREGHTWNGNAFDGDATEARIAAAAQRAGLEPAYQAVRPDLLEGRGE